MGYRVRKHAGDRQMGLATAVSKGSHSIVRPREGWSGGQTRQEIGKALLHQALGEPAEKPRPRELIPRCHRDSRRDVQSH